MRALITGASSGIGKDISLELAAKGYDCILVARNMEKLLNVKKEIESKYSVNVVIFQADLNDTGAVKNVFENNKDIDVLINNAGLGDFGKFDETELDKDLCMIDTNIKALHILTKLYLKEMKRKDKGYILNVASIAGFLPGPLMATYYATKNYVVRLSEAIRVELAREKSKVKISILCPGPVSTNFNNVANVRFDLKALSSEYVAKYAVKNMFKNKFYIVPGISVNLASKFSRFLPNKLLGNICYLMQKKKDEK